jgi:hypothetical protein
MMGSEEGAMIFLLHIIPVRPGAEPQQQGLYYGALTAAQESITTPTGDPIFRAIPGGFGADITSRKLSKPD